MEFAISASKVNYTPFHFKKFEVLYISATLIPYCTWHAIKLISIVSGASVMSHHACILPGNEEIKKKDLRLMLPSANSLSSSDFMHPKMVQFLLLWTIAL